MVQYNIVAARGLSLDLITTAVHAVLHTSFTLTKKAATPSVRLVQYFCAMGLFNKLKSTAFGSKKSSERGVTSDTAAEDDKISTTAEKEDATETSLRPLQIGSYDFGDGYSYPSLFEEADDMVKLSTLIYSLIELREVARSGKLDGHPRSLQILDLPLAMDNALSIIATEAELLKEILSDGAHDQALSALQALTGPQLDARAVDSSDGMIGGLLDMWSCCPGAPSSEPVDGKAGNSDYTVSTIIAVGDEKCNDELVYVVGVNPMSKRITVAFRGSTTKTDFLTDAKIDMVSVPDPERFASSTTDSNLDKGESNICIHRGFYEYLFGSEKGQSKYEEIMLHVQKLFESNPKYRDEYKLYVTGHSLGGALATLFGLYASASSIPPQPVTVVSVASPRVGNLEFAALFTEYESQGKIRHLRVANHKDPVTLAPAMSSKRMLTLGSMMFSPIGYLALKLSGNEAGAEESYHHTGMKMKLRNEVQDGSQRCELSYSGAQFLSKALSRGLDSTEDASGKKNSMLSLTSSDVPLVSYHYGRAYTDRMALVKEELAGLTLNQLYKTKTGNE
ncbi:hypothetical protein HJC23_009528 [Cyclotella cryptica]|uniref:Fungal lipase-type domain-containing protein n=1 Tax=Cyclotella cryptica TaxID=29204 RepID=A0ABD3Q5C4_9STRA|eukprot:CCRYP_008843-RA/>CCRYP_008843-RA protein AED:0.00 eAED:0.00 QI:67/-1/1/1/-1/1/1/241/562